ncbi:hypothetical protein SPAN111604_00895 [Sphingomonas antarctica]|uniref:hypothetical protein n=1 Tax=Sphingomonas antarctica TaxID=2040274 RepID=UPI0039E741B8
MILGVLAAEFLWLTIKAGWPVQVALWRLLPGALMMVALRTALTGADWRWTALALALSFPAHLADLFTGPRPKG